MPPFIWQTAGAIIASVLAALVLGALRQLWRTGMLLTDLTARMRAAERRLDRAEARLDGPRAVDPRRGHR